jgi:homoserine/homoserine lactone efflux protein
MTLDLWLAYVAVLFVVCIAPGPAVILSSAQAAARGVRSSLAVIAGIEIANLLYFLLSAFGLGAIIAASETAFLAIKYIGGAYLVFLGIRALLSRPAAAQPQPTRQMWRRAFLHGFASQLANPKSVLFYAALLPQFIVPGPGVAQQLLILAATGIAVEVPILVTYAALAARGGALVASSGFAWREWLTGSALIAAGAAVLLTRRTA